MATLKEGLTISVRADTAELRKGMQQAEQQVVKSTKEMSKSTEGVVDRLDKLKGGIEKVKGVALFFTAALTAGAAAALKYGDAMTKLDAANTLAAKSTENLRGKVKAAADVVGITHVQAAQKAREAIVTGYGDAEVAVISFGKAAKLSALGFGSPEEIDRASRRVAQAFQIPIDKAQEFGAKASVAGAGGLAEILDAAVDLRPALNDVGLSLDSFVENVAQLRDRGATTGQAIGLVSDLVETFRGRNEEATRALDQLGLSFGGTKLAGDNLASLLASLTQQQDTQSQSVAAALSNNQQFLDVLKGIGSGGAGGFIQQIGEMDRVVSNLNGSVANSKSTLDELKEALLNLQGPLQSIANFLDTVTTKAQAAITAFEGWVNSSVGSKILSILSAPADVAGSLGLPGFAAGGTVPGSGNGDTVPAMLTPGEFVVRKDVAKQIMPFLQELNKYGFKAEDLFGTFLTNSFVQGKHLLTEVLGLHKPNKRGLQPIDPVVAASAGPSAGAVLNGIAARILGTLNSLQFNKGGVVPPSTPTRGGNTTINATFNTRATSIDEAFVRRSVIPLLSRISGDYGQNRRGKSGL